MERDITLILYIWYDCMNMREYIHIYPWNIIKNIWFTQCLNFFSNPAIVRFLWKKKLSKELGRCCQASLLLARSKCAVTCRRGALAHLWLTHQLHSIASNVQQVQILKILQQIAWCFIAYTVAYTMSWHHGTRLQRVRVAVNRHPWSCAAWLWRWSRGHPLRHHSLGWFRPTHKAEKMLSGDKWCRVVQHGVAHLQGMFLGDCTGILVPGVYENVEAILWDVIVTIVDRIENWSTA